MTQLEIAQVPTRSTFRFWPSDGSPLVQVGVRLDGFIVYAVKLVGDTWQPAPEHPFVASVIRELNRKELHL